MHTPHLNDMFARSSRLWVYFFAAAFFAGAFFAGAGFAAGFATAFFAGAGFAAGFATAFFAGAGFAAGFATAFFAGAGFAAGFAAAFFAGAGFAAGFTAAFFAGAAAAFFAGAAFAGAAFTAGFAGAAHFFAQAFLAATFFSAILLLLNLSCCPNPHLAHILHGNSPRRAISSGLLPGWEQLREHPGVRIRSTALPGSDPTPHHHRMRQPAHVCPTQPEATTESASTGYCTTPCGTIIRITHSRFRAYPAYRLRRISTVHSWCSIRIWKIQAFFLSQFEKLKSLRKYAFSPVKTHIGKPARKSKESKKQSPVLAV
jgi:hypothetical protein